MRVPEKTLAAIEKHFHELLRDISPDFKRDEPPELPVLTRLEGEGGTRRIQHVTIPGMFGGCSYGFVTNDEECYLKVVASSRMDHNFKRVLARG